jgi:hypothetical protein
MFRIDRIGAAPGQQRLVADSVLTADDFNSIAAALGQSPFVARKTGFVLAREAVLTEAVSTQWNGIESRDVAAPGDFIVTNLTADRQIVRDASGHPNTYVVRAGKFASLYEAALTTAAAPAPMDTLHRARGRVDALSFSGGFDIAAPWGERQVGPVGYLLRNGDDIYGNHKDTFEATYERDI